MKYKAIVITVISVAGDSLKQFFLLLATEHEERVRG